MPSARRFVRTRLRGPLERLSRHEVDEAIRRSPSIVAKVMPIDPQSATLTVSSTRSTSIAPDGLPLPPNHLREVDDPDDYVVVGDEHFDGMREALRAAGYPPDQWGTVLELGVGGGRLIRHLADHATRHEVWGVDINAESIAWCEANLSPPLRFAPCSTFPHLPFEDGTFDLVYAGSVFTHISELAKTWLLELRRVTRPGGFLYLTVQDQEYVRLAQAQAEGGHWTNEMAAENRELLARLGDDLSMVSIDRSNKDAMVYFDRDHLVRSWGEVLEVVQVLDAAYHTQTAFILRKRPVSERR